VSLLDWAAELPDWWEAKPLRSTADYVVSNVDKVPDEHELSVRLCNYTDVYNNEFITLALDFMQATASEDEIAKFGLVVDDVVITKDSESWDDIGVPALVRESANDLVCGYHLALLRPHKKKMDGAFLFRCLQAKPIRVQLELAANGVTRFGIPKSEIGAMMLPVPPLPQQRAIVDYLDRETARLDALAAAKEGVLGRFSDLARLDAEHECLRPAERD
jgi:type I restriction enzyme, S subunit